MSERMNDDEKFDTWLRDAAAEYHRPPASVPRDEMWSAIQASRATSAAPPLTPALTPVQVRRSAIMPNAWRIAAGAVLILGAGFGIGRLTASRGGASSAVVGGVASTDGARDAGARPSVPNEGVRTTSPAHARPGDANPAYAAGMPGDSAMRRGRGYDLAAVEHFAKAEALLTSFQGGRPAGHDAADATLDRWARDLLADTRLLLDSPAAADARRRHLLEDLELVLAQIVQLPAEPSAERSAIRRSIEGEEVLTRIRSTIPAGVVTSGT